VYRMERARPARLDEPLVPEGMERLKRDRQSCGLAMKEREEALGDDSVGAGRGREHGRGSITGTEPFHRMDPHSQHPTTRVSAQLPSRCNPSITQDTVSPASGVSPPIGTPSPSSSHPEHDSKMVKVTSNGNTIAESNETIAVGDSRRFHLDLADTSVDPETRRDRPPVRSRSSRFPVLRIHSTSRPWKGSTKSDPPRLVGRPHNVSPQIHRIP